MGQSSFAFPASKTMAVISLRPELKTILRPVRFKRAKLCWGSPDDLNNHCRT